ncbi:hypothetical protein ACLF6K_35900 [Streptomyces xanthophaeus]|uniref:hypothetical protein n=1 Tax=Streptomyces xanthophaeus TaxID=67385 RepID=UPI00398FA4D1
MTGYDSLTFTRQTAEQIVADLRRDSCGLSGSWTGDVLTFTATKDYDGEGFTYTVMPDTQGRYTIGALWPWDTWSADLASGEQSHAYARGALAALEPADPAYSAADAAAWRRGKAEAANLLQIPTATQSRSRSRQLPSMPQSTVPSSGIDRTGRAR